MKNIFQQEQEREQSVSSDPVRQLLDAKEAAEFLNVSKNTLTQWKKRGLIKPVVIHGHSQQMYWRSQLVAAAQAEINKN